MENIVSSGRFICLFYFSAFLILSGCDQLSREKNDERKYRIVTDGEVSNTDREKYSDNTVSFTRTQKYKISLIGDGGQEPHFLVANVLRKVGSKTESDQRGVLIPITDRSATYDCPSFYFAISREKEESIKDPVCTFDLIGYLDFTGVAKSIK